MPNQYTGPIRVLDRFWAKVVKNGPTMPGMESPCWSWTASLSAGYGCLRIEGRTERAHRLSWEIHNGPIPDGMDVLHRCDHRPCARPDHLFLGTALDNMHDAAIKGRMPTGGRHWTHAQPERVPRGERQSGAKLTAQDVLAIRKRLHLETRAAIAADYGVSRAAISSIALGRNWRHIQ